MNRRKFITVIGGLAVWPQIAYAQEPKMRRVGALLIGNADMESFQNELRGGLRELGYIEGQNILFEFRSAEGILDRLPGLATELVRLKVEASRAVEFHHRALTEPYVSLSTHTAPSIRPFAYKSRQWGKSPGVRLTTPASHVRARFGRCLRCLNLR